MESNSARELTNRKWLLLFVRATTAMQPDRVLSGNNWFNPTVRFLVEQVRNKSRRVWFRMGRESLRYYMEIDTARRIKEMNLVFNSAILRTNMPQSILMGSDP